MSHKPTHLPLHHTAWRDCRAGGQAAIAVLIGPLPRSMSHPIDASSVGEGSIAGQERLKPQQGQCIPMPLLPGLFPEGSHSALSRSASGLRISHEAPSCLASLLPDSVSGRPPSVPKAAGLPFFRCRQLPSESPLPRLCRCLEEGKRVGIRRVPREARAASAVGPILIAKQQVSTHESASAG